MKKEAAEKAASFLSIMYTNLASASDFFSPETTREIPLLLVAS
ncbi:hypothetical protein OZL92_21935 [Bacillus sonorensis]|nr:MULTISPECIES: hypothetical protein [Bacillus]TWK74620.1 hypothetical protein CHCC20335_3034 [Bacillus paralicheniformis]MCZ0070781.1 hypothetical protein [Bacillus sonorensis]MCZ0074877.1 hypothetical protein [Bacillus sonorensis]MCZ0093985.1 hypothetical protein [Bacillus sonorensis]MCZ0098142.1 hypothetical protein [Bacillus sonorensis]